MSKYRNLALVTIGCASLAVGLTACSSGASKGGSTAAPAQVTTTVVQAAATSGNQPSSSPASNSQPSSDQPSSGSSGGDQQSSATPTSHQSSDIDTGSSSPLCTADTLSGSLGATPSGDGQATLVVTLTNTGSASCHMSGFPQVTLVASGAGNPWPINHSSQTPTRVTLAPGASAYIGITYLPYDSPDNGIKFSVDQIELVLPNTSKEMDIGINQGQVWNVIDQSAATHPGTFTGPVLSSRPS